MRMKVIQRKYLIFHFMCGFFLCYLLSVIKSKINERTPLFVSDLHLIGLIIQRRAKNPLVFPSSIRRIIIHLARCVRKPTKTQRHSKAQLLITTFCHCFYTQSIMFAGFYAIRMHTQSDCEQEQEREREK